MARGRFIVIYGINNLGKTTQAQLLSGRIDERVDRKRSIYFKYPIYNLEPTGPMINAYLRKGNPLQLSAREAQMLYVQNRMQFQSEILRLLDEGTDVVAEDYTGTGIAWGMAAGVSKDFLIKLNESLIQEDIAFLFDGKRFLQGREAVHAHEGNDSLTERARLAHLELAKDFGWHVVDANRPISTIHDGIWTFVRPLLGV